MPTSPTRRRLPALALALAAALAGPAGRRAQAQEPEQLFDTARIREIRLSFNGGDWQSILQRNRGQGKETKARLTVDGTVLEEIGVRYKGNTSLSVAGPKKPLNLSLDAFVPGQKLLGYDVINLNNGWADPSQVREAVAYSLLREYMPMPRASFARVYANDGYVGLYLMVEQIDRTFADTWFASGDGFIIKGDNPSQINLESSTLNYQAALRSYKTGYEVKNPGADADAGYRALQRLTQVLDAATTQGGVSDQDFPAAARQALDVDAALWYLAANNLLANYDSYYAGHNYYLFQGERDGRFTILNWDWNLSFGTFQTWFTQPRKPIAETDPFDQATQRNRPLLRRLLKVGEFRADYVAHLRTLRDEALDPARIGELGQAYQDQIREAVAAEPRPLYPVASFEENLRQDVTLISQGGVGGERSQRVPGVLALAEARRAYLSDPELQPALVAPDLALELRALEPQAPATGQAVRVTARLTGTDAVQAVELRYRVARGPEARLAMNLAPDGAWVTEIPSQPAGKRVTYFLRAALADGRSAFFPSANLVRPFDYRVQGVDIPSLPAGDLVINELMADNETGPADAAGDREDWVELYNRGAAPVDLAGWYLSDDPQSPWDHPLPAVTLPPRGRLLIWADGETAEGADHASFRLAKEGESLVLARRDGLYDQVTFPPQTADESHGRRLDGADAWTACWPASPAAPNDCRARGWRSFVPWAAAER